MTRVGRNRKFRDLQLFMLFVMKVKRNEKIFMITLRTDKAAHPQMRELMIPLLKDFAQRWPILFADIVWGFEPNAEKIEEVLSKESGVNWLTSPYDNKVKFHYPRLDKDDM